MASGRVPNTERTFRLCIQVRQLLVVNSTRGLMLGEWVRYSADFLDFRSSEDFYYSMQRRVNGLL